MHQSIVFSFSLTQIQDSYVPQAFKLKQQKAITNITTNVALFKWRIDKFLDAFVQDVSIKEDLYLLIYLYIYIHTHGLDGLDIRRPLGNLL